MFVPVCILPTPSTLGQENSVSRRNLTPLKRISVSCRNTGFILKGTSSAQVQIPTWKCHLESDTRTKRFETTAHLSGISIGWID
jgi:hypothetical protein